MSTIRRSVRRRRTALLAVALVASVCASTVATVVAPGVASAGTGASGLGYTPVTPCRAVSTVSGSAVAAGTTRTFRIAGSGAEFTGQGGTAGGCGIPDNVPAVVVSVTAVDPSGDGFLRVFAAGATEPNATFLNYTTGTGITNTGVVKLATSGVVDLAVAAHTNDTDVVIDVQGYYSASSSVYFKALTPCRVLNTVAGAGTPFAPNESRQVQVAGTGANFAAQGGTAGGCGIPDGANAVEVSITAVGGTGNGFVRTAKAGTADADMKGTLLNYTSAQNITNTATVDLATSGTLDLKIRNFGATTDLVVDVQGYYSITNTGRFMPLNPCRVLNTKARNARLPANGARGVHVAGTFVNVAAQGLATTSLGCGIDDDATAVAASVTAVEPEGDGFVRAWPMGSTPPTATMLNYADGRAITNTGALALAPTGVLDLVVRNFSGTTDVVIDVGGYFAPAADSLPPTQVLAGDTSSCFTAQQTGNSAGNLRCWGGNGRGQLGNNTLTDSSTPVTVRRQVGASTPAYPNPAKISGGFSFNCALLVSRKVDCWGFNFLGGLGFDTAPENYAPMPGRVGLGTLSAIDISAGGLSACAVITDGTVRCWGLVSPGNGAGVGSSTPAAASGVEDAVQITTNSAGFGLGSHTCILRETGGVQCWGFNEDGQLGDGTTNRSNLPVNVVGLSGVTQVAAGAKHTCAIVAGGAVKCWGRNDFGQLGDGTTTRRLNPVTVNLGGVPAVQVAGGAEYTCALLADSSVRCWGRTQSGQLGIGSTSGSRTTPVAPTVLVIIPLNPIPVVKFVAFTGNTDLSVGTTHACTLSTASAVRCWGRNAEGQIGPGAAVLARPTTVADLP